MAASSVRGGLATRLLQVVRSASLKTPSFIHDPFERLVVFLDIDGAVRDLGITTTRWTFLNLNLFHDYEA
jgi:hypothetical protein